MFSLNKFPVFLTILLALTSFSECYPTYSPGDNDTLYGPEDDVVSLTAKNFNQTLHEKPYAWFIEFYNRWCGYCQRFSPVYEAFASDIKNWDDLVKVGAINCVHEDNTELCYKFEITAYPILRYIHEDFQVDSNETGIVIGRQDVDIMRQRLVQQMIDEQVEESRGKMYPNLQPYPDSDTTNLLKKFENNQINYILLVIEEGRKLLGPTLALDLHKFKEIYVTYALSMNNTLLVEELGVVPDNQTTTLIVIKRDSTKEKFTNNIHDRKSLLEAAINYFKSESLPISIPNFAKIYTNEPTTPKPSSESPKSIPPLLNNIKTMGDVVFQEDLETAVRFSLRREVLRQRITNGEKLDSLLAYLDVLNKYFPFSPEGKLFLSELTKTINSNNSTVVERNSILELIKKAEDHDSKVYKSTHQEWLACMGSTGTHRGYPCGLWKLFHYLSVNANNESNPTEILNAMHGYIKNYFGCSDCSQHFQEMAQRRNISSVTSLNSSVIWLWEAHNEVNKRLAGDETEDPQFPKIQYPSKENCPDCRLSDSSWDYDEVLGYLREVYGRENIQSFDSIIASTGSGRFGLSMTLIYVCAMFYWLN